MHIWQVKGVAEGLSIKLGEMIDTPRHQRIAKLAKEEEEKKKGKEMQQGIHRWGCTRDGPSSPLRPRSVS